MPLVVAEGVVLGSEKWSDGETRTKVAVGDTVVTCRGNGYERLEQVFIVGDLRSSKSGLYMREGVLYPAGGQTLTDVVEVVATAGKAKG